MAYQSELSKYVGANNLNLTSHYATLGHRGEMKNYLNQLQDTYEQRESHLKTLVDDFCNTVGKNNLLCHRDRVRHKTANSDFMTLEYETPSGLFNFEIRNKFGLENVKRAWRPCDPTDPDGCVRGAADANTTNTTDSSCGMYRGGYQMLTSATPQRCEQPVSGLPRYHQLTMAEATENSKFLNDTVREEVRFSESN